MEFNEALKQLIIDNGGFTSENLQLGVERARKKVPYFTGDRLKLLLAGLSPTDDDREAISHAFEPERDKWLSQSWHLEESLQRDIARRTYAHIKNIDMVKDFVEYVDIRSSFREMYLPEGEFNKLLRAFQETRRPLDEIELFGLGERNA